MITQAFTPPELASVGITGIVERTGNALISLAIKDAILCLMKCYDEHNEVMSRLSGHA